MKDNRYYYDEQIKEFYYKSFYHEFVKIKEEIKENKLEDLLLFQTKQGIIDIAKRLEIRGYSKLTKEALVTMISESIVAKIPEILSDITYKELMFLKPLLSKKANKFTFNVEELTSLGALCSLGVLYKFTINYEYYIVVADEFKKPLNSVLKDEEKVNSIKEKSRGIAYIDGLMAHYGMLFGNDLYNIVSENKNNVFDNHNMDYYLNYIFRAYEAFTDANSLIHPYLFSPADIVKEISVRQNIPYQFDNIDYFINLGYDYNHYYGENEEKLRNVLIEKGISKSDVDLVITKLMYIIKNDLGTMSLIQFLEESGAKFDTEDDADELVEVLVTIYNNTPMWIFKGLTILELNERRKTVVKKEKEPGRNDPCPCGSGKKYKKCCYNKYH